MKQVKITTTATVINTDAQQTQRMTSLELLNSQESSTKT